VTNFRIISKRKKVRKQANYLNVEIGIMVLGKMVRLDCKYFV
jgi:hypothetical protein